MDDKLNVTYLIVGGYLEVHKYRYLYFVIVLTAYILIITCNSIIVYLIWIHQNLHEPMYIFIAALLINAILWSTAICPKLLNDFLSEKQIISYSACLLQFYLIYSLGSSEFFLLAAMAYDRYVSICKPLQYHTIMRKTKVSILLIFAWILPASLIAVATGLSSHKKLCGFVLKSVFCNNTVYKLQCGIAIAETIRDMVGLLINALSPLLFILFTYIRILRICYQSNKEVRRKAAQTCLPHLIVLTNFSCLCFFDVITIQLDLDFPEILRLIMTFLLIMFHPLLNPIIYGLKIKEIFKHLKTLFLSVKQI
ncbi:olfactory receptor 6N1-like [Kryptolebias marmoratus]|uniref:Olfactory receptor n=1 Tax=Kryptolebias marmoratus TaxID=37003 RepID=A0A3Q2ZJX5_KRYMA|nr:olfactory receptor 6N1-like [Kryptolebias marmoratus]